MKSLKLFFSIGCALIGFWLINIQAARAEDTGCCHVLESGTSGHHVTVTPTECQELNKNFTTNLQQIFIAGKEAAGDGYSGCQDKDANEGEKPRVIKPLGLSLQVSIPGFEKFSEVICDDPETPCAIPWLAEYIKALYNYSLLVISILAVVVLMIGGLMWLTSRGNRSQIEQAQHWIRGAITGIILAFCSYTILFLVNPNLTILRPITISYIEKIDLEIIPPQTYQQITGSAPIQAFGPEMMGLISKVSSERGFDPCFLYAFVAKESEGRVNVVGHDENVTRIATKSNAMYETAKRTFKGTVFSKFEKNDDTPVCTDKEDLCLDWRYSHGIGLTQVTIFPWDNVKKNGAPAKVINGKTYSPRELFLPDTSLYATADYLKESGCGQDLYLCFRKYNGSGPAAEQYAKEASEIFSKCKKNGLPT